MIISEEKNGGTLLLRLRGKIDTEAAEQLLHELNARIEQGQRSLLLDFCGVDYINSSGLGTILMAAKKLNDLDGRIALANVSELVHHVLRISGCASVIGIYPSEEEALIAWEAKDTAARK